jgi:hypothetical protein
VNPPGGISASRVACADETTGAQGLKTLIFAQTIPEVMHNQFVRWKPRFAAGKRIQKAEP